MYSWQYNEKIFKEMVYNHSMDFGRFYCQLMLDAPLLYGKMMEGFFDEFSNRFRQGQRTGGDDSPPSDKNGVSGR